MTSMPTSATAYQDQLNQKRQAIVGMLANLGHPPGCDLTLHTSAHAHYRMRVEFRVWHTQDDLFYAMFPQGNKRDPIRIDCFPHASETIGKHMQPLLQAIKSNDLLSHKLFQVDFLSSQTGDLLVSLLYHRALDEQWLQAATALGDDLGIKVIGRARKQKLVIGDDFVTETLTVDGHSYHYQQVENAFTQPNAGVNEKMLTWAKQQSQQHFDPDKPDLLELYCGNGNFTLPLAACYRQVLATEIAKSSVASAHTNLQQNGISNVTIARLASEEMSQALAKVRAFRRLQDVDLDSYAFGSVLVDPPRAGLDHATLGLVRQFDTIIYISCNPNTLMANIDALGTTHKVTACAMFDQFPFTPHIEAGVVLSRH